MNLNLWLRVAVAAALLGVCAARELGGWRIVPSASPGHTEEAVCLRATLEQATPADRATLGSLYAAMAKAVDGGKLVATTQQLADGTSNAIELAFGGRRIVPGVDVGAQVDAVVAAAIGGMHDVAISDANRSAVANGLREVAWACGAAR